MKLKYCGPALDFSGYGEAVRHDIASLVSAGVDVTCEIPKYTLEISDFGKLGNLAKERENKPLDYDIKLIHTTPNVFQTYMEVGKYHIGRVIWETDKLPMDFAKSSQLVDEIWTASDFNKKAIEKAGVTKPIYIVPEAIAGDINPDTIQPYVVPDKEAYKFYSIFEWTERKNPVALLTAYWQEFKPSDNVNLVIKTYVDNFTPQKHKEIDDAINVIKRKLNLDYYAPVFLFKELMDRNQIYRFHRTFDCFVSTHRGEGWGIPQMEAMLMKKPIISTNCGGVHEYLKDGKHALLLSPTMVPLKSNSRNRQWYTQDQNWAEVDIKQVRNAMRYVYENRDKAAKIGENAREHVLRSFDISKIGSIMKARLEEIQATLNPTKI